MKKILFSLLLILGIIAVAMAMNNGVENKAMDTEVSTTTSYFYNGPSEDLEDHVDNPSNWDTVQNNNYACTSPLDIPCNLPVPEDMSIEEYLEDLGTPQAIINASAKGRTP